MSVEKHLKVTGTSEISWKDAIVQTINEATKTIDYITSVTIFKPNCKNQWKENIRIFQLIQI